MNKLETGYKDHTGQMICVGDCVRIANRNDEWNAIVVCINHAYYIRSVEDGDEVELRNIHDEIEVLKTFDEAAQSGKLVVPNADGEARADSAAPLPPETL